MTISHLTRVLDQHGITYEVIDGRVIAENSYSIEGTLYTDSLDLTDISAEQLYDWLGY